MNKLPYRGSRYSRRSLLQAGTLGVALAGASAIAGPPLRLANAAQTNGQLLIGQQEGIITFDPHISVTIGARQTHSLVYESLVALDDGFKPMPRLAQNWETPNDLTYVFSLRQGVLFHNGRELVAEDVVFSLQRVLDPKTGSNWASRLAAIERVEARDQRTVVVTLSRPYAPLPQALAAQAASIVPGQEVASGVLDLTREMVGTGPLQFAEHFEDQRTTLRRFADYWGPEASGIDQVTWMIMPDEAGRVAALRTGEIHMATLDNPRMLDLLAQDASITTAEQLTTNSYVLFLNANKPALADQRVRQAVALSLDRDQIKALALSNHAQVTGPIPAGFGDLATPPAELPFYGRDVPRAKQLLADAGQEDLTLGVWVSPGVTLTVTIAQVMQSQLAEAGINLELQQREVATFVNEYFVEGVHDLAISWWSGYSDPNMVLANLLSTGVAPTVLGLSDPAIDDKIERAGAETDLDARKTILRELELELATLANYQPLVTRNDLFAYRNDLVGDVTVPEVEWEGTSFPLGRSLLGVTVR
jgi:peptide/nickel transport system substrate-binding protein